MHFNWIGSMAGCSEHFFEVQRIGALFFSPLLPLTHFRGLVQEHLALDGMVIERI